MSFLQERLDKIIAQNRLRTLKPSSNLIDFCSNDYLGISYLRSLEGGVRKQELGIKSDELKPKTYNSKNSPVSRHQSPLIQGSTGSRLLTGNNDFTEKIEKFLSNFHKAEAGLIFNSGYDANLGVLSCIPNRGDVILYDFLAHASLRDGVRLSFAEGHSFLHNDIVDLEKKLTYFREKSTENRIFIVTESVFSMDGDICPLPQFIQLCKKYKAHLILDEAHSTGIIGENGEGLAVKCGVEKEILVRVHTFGKAMGTHGSVVVGSNVLRNYLINFCRTFIYTTALPPHSIHQIYQNYLFLKENPHLISQLNKNIELFKNELIKNDNLMDSDTPIQGFVLGGNEKTKAAAQKIQEAGFDVRAILYPTVPKNTERLRINIHAFNTPKEIKELTKLITLLF